MLDTSQESKPLPESNDAQEPDGIAAPDPDPIATKPAEPTTKASLSVDVVPPVLVFAS